MYKEIKHKTNVEDYIYVEMIDTNIASHPENPVFTDHKWNEVEVHDRFGLAQEMKIDHSDYIFLADESGF